MSAREEFIVVCASVVGNPDQGFEIVYGWDGTRHKTIATAIKDGWKKRESDDFNIGAVRGETLVRFGWMRELTRDREEIVEVARQLDLCAPPA